MTCGAGGALNVTFKALLDPGDEVVVIAPYFGEYVFYVDFEGNSEDEVVSEMLSSLSKHTERYKMLGCYPAA